MMGKTQAKKEAPNDNDQETFFQDPTVPTLPSGKLDLNDGIVNVINRSK